MSRNPIVPFIVIMVFGIGLMFLLSFKGLGDAEDLAKEAEGGGEKTEVAAANPEDIFQQSCTGCHAIDTKKVGPALKGVGERLTHDQIKEVLTKGKGTMPGGLVPEDKADDLAKWLEKQK